MPPWSSRLPTTPTTEPSSSTSIPGGARSRQHDSARHIHQGQYHRTRATDPLHFAAAPAESSLRRVPIHGRSVSHPFPSLFGSGQKLERTNDEPVSNTSLGATVVDDYGASMPLPRSTSRKGQAAHSEGDFMTGNCATCNSTVRWPRYLDIYRCTVCLMVNDLKPAPRQPTIQEPGKTLSEPSTTRISRKALALSCERSRSLVDQSIKIYLEQRAKHVLTQSQAEPAGVPAYGQRADSLGGEDGGGLQDSCTPDNGHSSDLKRITFTSPPSKALTGVRDQLSILPSVPNPIPEKNPSASLESGTLDQRSPNTFSPTENIESQEATAESAKNRGSSQYIFRQLENYLVSCLNDCECINTAFMLSRPLHPTRASSEASAVVVRPNRPDSTDALDDPLFEVDAKTLLLGDIGENGTWWAGGRRTSERRADRDFEPSMSVDRRALRFDWTSILQWYDTIMYCGKAWKVVRQSLPADQRHALESNTQERAIEQQLGDARYHVQRTFLKSVENLLRRPGKPIKSPSDCRFLLVLLLNPFLYLNHKQSVTQANADMFGAGQGQQDQHAPQISHNTTRSQSTSRGSATGHHSGIVKRILGLIANVPTECHQAIVSWFCRLPEPQFRCAVDLVGGFVSYRLGRQSSRKRSSSHDPTAGLIPEISGPGAGTSAHLHAALGTFRHTTAKEPYEHAVVYADDWQIRVAAKAMSLLFSANSSGKHTYHDTSQASANSPSMTPHVAIRQRAYNHAKFLPTSAFYNTMLDYADLISDFETWEARRGKFSFCQYPMFLSIWAKIRIMEHDAHRQMEIKARDAFFTSILSRKAVNQYLVLKVHRDCLVDDSLRSVSEVVGTGQEEIKKGLKIEFLGEEGVDAGGLRKEWFLLLVREVFDPDHGLFVYDEDSHYCYFNPSTFETSDQFFLVGVVLGLAIYNSTILDVALPPFAFKKLLASAPSYSGPVTTAIRPSTSYTLDDLAEWRPTLARGLRQLLDHDGDVEGTFCRDFVADVERYGQVIQVPLCANGQNRPVTSSNRREFVDLYIRYLLDSSVVRQFEPFKRGFFTVCGGNALSLFRPEEIELLIRGSDEPLDIASLRAVAIYENWPPDKNTADPRDREPSVVKWFWEIMDSIDSTKQKALLTFITGSDRIPAMGTTSLIIKVVYLTEDCHRFPVARTCFNMLGLHRYRSKNELHSRLWRAVEESEGFGLR